MQSINKKIFVADDDADILEIISIMLQIKGYEVITSRDAREVNSFDKNNRPDLVLLDVWMSGVDGREVCRNLKTNETTKDIPVLFISANSNIEDITTQYFADGYISKPFEMDGMLARINSTLAARSPIGKKDV